MTTHLEAIQMLQQYGSLYARNGNLVTAKAHVCNNEQTVIINTESGKRRFDSGNAISRAARLMLELGTEHTWFRD